MLYHVIQGTELELKKNFDTKAAAEVQAATKVR